MKKTIPVVELTDSEKKALKEGREEMERGEYLTLKQLKDEIFGIHRRTTTTYKK